MQPLNLSEHIVNAVYIVRTNTVILWFLALIGIMSSVSSLYPDSRMHGFFIFIFICTAIFATPIIYGIFYEIIDDSYSSVPQIGKKYLPSYLWLLLRLYLPVVFFAALPMMSAPESVSPGYFQMVVITCSLIFIYIIPYYYVTGKQQGAVLGGIKFLSQNISASAPLILLSLITESILLVFEMKKSVLFEFNKFIYSFAEFFIYMTANIIDFILFITMVFVLRKAITETNENNSEEVS